MADVKQSVFLTELDSVLDTRLGTLLAMDADKVASLLANGYHKRLKDEFPGFNMSEYWQRYAKRDAGVLMNSMATPMLEMLHDFVLKTLKQTLRTPFHKNPKIELNIYPFKLSEEVVREMVRCVAAATGGLCDVEAVDYSPQQLNPLFIKERYDVVTMYDYHLWYKAHIDSGLWSKYTCPNVSVFAPMMVKSEQVQVTQQLYDKIVDDTELITNELRPFFQLQSIPVAYFSWVFEPESFKRQQEQEAAKQQQQTQDETESSPKMEL